MNSKPRILEFVAVWSSVFPEQMPLLPISVLPFFPLTALPVNFADGSGNCGMT